MKPVLKRIAINGGLTAVVLGIIGLGLTELAGMFITAGGSAPRVVPVENVTVPASAPPVEPVRDLIRYRLPLLMAGWGFVFVAIGELILVALRGEPKRTVVAPLVPDPAEKLLEELLAQADAALLKSVSSPATNVSEPSPATAVPGHPDAPAAPGHSDTPQSTDTP